MSGTDDDDDRFRFSNTLVLDNRGRSDHSRPSVGATIAAQVGSQDTSGFFVDRKGCDLVRGRTSCGCVRRGSRVLLSRSAGLWRTALLADAGGVRVLRDRLLWRLALWNICPNQADESKWCGTRAQTLKRDALCPCLDRELVRIMSWQFQRTRQIQQYGTARPRQRRVSSHSRLPTKDSRVAVRSDGPTP